MAIVEDSRGREIRVGDWGGGSVLAPDDGGFAPQEVQGRVVGFDEDEDGVWVIVRPGKGNAEHRLRATEMRTVAARPRIAPAPRKGWRRFF